MKYLGKMVGQILDTSLFDRNIYARYFLENLIWWTLQPTHKITFRPTPLELLFLPVHTEIEVIKRIDKSVGELGYVTNNNGQLKINVKLVDGSGIGYIVLNCRTITHELTHLYFEILRLKMKVSDKQIAEMHRKLHVVDVYSYDSKYFDSIKILGYNLSVVNAIKIAEEILSNKY